MEYKKNKKVNFKKLGLIDYKQCWDYQTDIFTGIVDVKIKNRDLPLDMQKETENYLLFCQHPHVYTLGKSGTKENLLINEEALIKRGASYYEINRGGDITYHGPGQLVAYPILDLDNFFTDIHKYMRFLEESVILTLKDFGIEAGRVPGLTGVWINFQDEKRARKICAMGVKTSRWVTMHGLALNVNPDLHYFQNIIPCGIVDKEVTSIEKELGRKVEMAEVEKSLLKHMSLVFDLDII